MSCPYCEPQQHRIIKKYPHWTVLIADSQQLLGYSTIVLNRHIETLVDLSDQELLEFKQVCKELQHALHRTFMPDWFNYMQMGNFVKHLHFHLIPRYKTPRLFEGRQFVDERFGKSPERRWVFEDENFLEKLAQKIRTALSS